MSQAIFESSSLLDELPLLKNTPFNETLSHWIDIKPTNGIPHRRDLNPAGLKAVLEKVIVFDRLPNQGLEMRIAGDSVDQRFDFAIRGTDIFSVIPKETGQALLNIIDQTEDQPAAIYMRYLNEHADGTLLEERNVGLPLTDGSGKVMHSLTTVDGVDKTALYMHGPIKRLVAQFIEIKYGDLGFGIPEMPRV